MSATRRAPVERSRGCRRGRGRALGAMPQRVEVDLSARSVEQVAQRVAQLLGDRGRQVLPELLTAGELAHRLRVTRPWIYKHRHLLGGERIGDGPKAPWRFELETAKRGLAGDWAVQTTNGGG